MEEIFQPGYSNEINNEEVFTPPSEEVKETIADKLEKSRTMWTNKISDLNKRLKKFIDLTELMVDAYTERQIAVDYYYTLYNMHSKINKVFKTKYAEKYDYYSFKSQQRYPNETTKNNKILADLADIVESRDLLELQIKFMTESIKSIDNLVWGINHRIKIEELTAGLKL